ncbi:hypothetical protein MNBD_NITROSPINAE01-1074 [hydrothermal vent metagenome]|uniref:Permease often clustered with de novo purine synthesis n=1 Tax=hydrothermal vent metagenome TaxID=652676 RepID=A0A3B1BIR5_9ZZZZ
MDNLPLSKSTIKLILILLGITIFFFILYKARTALFPFVFAFGLAYLFDPVIDRMESKKIGRTSSIIILLTLLFTAFAVTTAFVTPLIVGQVETLADSIPGYIELAQKKAAPIIQALPDMNREKAEALIKNGMAKAGDLPLKVVRGASQALWTGLSNMLGLLLALFNLVIIPVATFYLLKDFDNITAKILERVPPRNRQWTIDFFGKIDAVLSNFMRGQLTIAFIMTLILSTGLMLIGTPMGLLIGVCAGLSNIVPYLPAVVGLVPALLLTYLQFGDFSHLLAVLLLFGGAQVFEGFVLSPKILEKAVGLHPVAVLAALLIGGSFFGFLGVLLAVPTAAVLKVAMVEADTAYMKSHFFKSDD